MRIHEVIIHTVLSIPVAALAVARPAQAAAEQLPAVREIEVVVDGGYQPGRITVTEGERVRLKFIRRDHSPCAREVVFAGLGIRRELSVDRPLVVELPALAAGEHVFTCGMNMIRGVLEVVARTP
jgi:plastocyanin domain-containing protein